MATNEQDTQEDGGSTAVAPQREQPSFKQLLAQNQSRLKNLLPDYMAPERYLSLAMLAINKTPQLRQAAIEAPETIIDSVLRAAQCGFEIGGAVPGAHLVPFRNKGRMECQMIPDYRGLINLAVESGAILSAEARVVYQGEHFIVLYGTEDRIIHEPGFDAIDNGEITAFYFVAKLTNGEKKFEVMTKDQVDKIRARSKAGSSGPWVTDYAEMGRKTVTKRGLKYVPMSPNNPAARKLALAIEADNRAEVGKATAYVPEWDDEASMSEDARDRTKEKIDDLRGRMSNSAEQEPEPSGEDVSGQSSARVSRAPEPDVEPPAQPRQQRRTRAAAEPPAEQRDRQPGADDDMP